MSEARVSTLEYEVRGYECGYGGPLSPFSLANYIQEAAGANADLLGFGMEEMDERHWTWMLSRLDLRVDGLPRTGERVSVSTWPSELRKLFAFRDFEMRGGDGRILARAVYAYLVVDLSARKPLRPTNVFGEDPPAVVRPHPVPDFSFDIPEASGWEDVFVQRVGKRHIDHNGHANNAHITNWLVDAAAAGPVRPELSALRIEFANEALEGDEVVARRGQISESPFGRGTAVATTLSRGDATVGRALVAWR